VGFHGFNVRSDVHAALEALRDLRPKLSGALPR
jgi:hypothetical protein